MTRMTSEEAVRLAMANPAIERALREQGVIGGKAPAKREEDTQRKVVTEIPLEGYRVLQTTVRKRPCPCCGKLDPRGYGATKGVPDTLICLDSWPLPIFAGVEVKGERTEVSEEQQDLANAGRIVIVRSVDEAASAVRRVDAVMRAIVALGEALEGRGD